MHYDPIHTTKSQHQYNYQREKLKKFIDFAQHSSHHDTSSSEQSLWRAVILQALIDATKGPHTRETQYQRNDAIYWLTQRNAHFALVCDLAGLDENSVRRKAKKALLAQCKWRAEPGQGKRHSTRRSQKRQSMASPARCTGAL